MIPEFKNDKWLFVRENGKKTWRLNGRQGSTGAPATNTKTHRVRDRERGEKEGRGGITTILKAGKEREEPTNWNFEKENKK